MGLKTSEHNSSREDGLVANLTYSIAARSLESSME